MSSGPDGTDPSRPRGGSASPPEGLLRFFDLEEKALREGRPSARVAAVVGPRALSVGVAVSDREGYLVRARSEGLAVVRRGSGGTALLHLPGDLLWSVVLPRSDSRVGHDFVRGYERLGAAVVEVLRSVGLSASWAEPPGLSEEYCPLGSRGKVLLAESRVLGGAAQHATAGALLHHGAIAVEVDRPTLDRLFLWSGPSPAARLGGLRELGVSAPVEELRAALLRRLSEFVSAA